MTVFVKPSIIPNKADNHKIPLVQGNLCPEAKIALSPLPPRRMGLLRRLATVLFHVLNIALVVLLFIGIGFVLYRQVTKPYHRYQGYCAVPIDIRFENAQMMDQEHRMMPLHWSSTNPEVQVMSSADDAAAEEFMNVLREELDIDGMIEKISVLNNGHQVNFIHDFSTNLTNIVDTSRCFTMELDPDMVLVPDAFVLSIERGGEFDITRVRSALKAMLPAVRDVTLMPPPCRSRPTYRLRRAELTIPVRKRSVDAPRHDFVHFSGKHVHEIEIGNMEELLAYERNATA